MNQIPFQNHCKPIEPPAARSAIAEAYQAMSMLQEAGLLDFISEAAFDKKAAEQVEHAMWTIESTASPNLLLSMLPNDVLVRFQTEEGIEPREGLVRDCRNFDGSVRRRITTIGPKGGFEVMADETTRFVHFEVLAGPR